MDKKHTLSWMAKVINILLGLLISAAAFLLFSFIIFFILYAIFRQKNDLFFGISCIIGLLPSLFLHIRYHDKKMFRIGIYAFYAIAVFLAAVYLLFGNR